MAKFLLDLNSCRHSTDG